MLELAIYGKPSFGSIRRQVDIPKPGPTDVIIKVVATGVNPKDWKSTANRDESNALNTGDDIAGIVEAVGDQVYEYKPGDRVAAFHRMFEGQGSYAEYSIAPASTTFPLPPNISFESGTTIPLAAMTAALALYQHLGLPQPTVSGQKDIPILIYGGASAVGAYALQLAKLSGLSPIITVAGSGIDFVKSLDAATHIVDYRKGDVANQILAVLDGKPLKHAFDAISYSKSYEVITKVLQASGGGHINMVDPPDLDDSNPEAAQWTWPEGVTFSRTFVASAYHKAHQYRTEEEAKGDGDFAFMFYRYIAWLLAQGKFKPHPYQVLPNGLDGVLDGVKALYDRKVSAKKLVARISETPGL